MTDNRTNFSSMYKNDVVCDLCDQKREQTVQHLLCCPEIVKNCKELQDNLNVQFEDIYGDMNTQIRALKVIQAVFKTKMEIESEDDNEV